MFYINIVYSLISISRSLGSYPKCDRISYVNASEIFSDKSEVILAYQTGKIGLTQRINARIENKIIETTAGKVIFNENKIKMLGYDIKEFRNVNYTAFTDIVHPEDHEKVMKAMRDHLEPVHQKLPSLQMK